MIQSTFSAGATYDFGTVIFSKADIIDFARKNDPLDFHTDLNIAQKHIFKNLVASGQHAFNYFYVNHWIPLFGNTVLCGLGVENWKFQKPIFPDQAVNCRLTITSVHPHEAKNSITVHWKFEFMNDEGVHFQQLEMSVLHRMASFD